MTDYRHLSRGNPRRARLTPLFLLVVLCLGTAGLSAKEVAHRHYLGTVGKYPVEMDLTVGSSVEGAYFYEHRGHLIALSGRVDENGEIKVKEVDYRGDTDKTSGIFTLKMAQVDQLAVLSGTWSPPNGGKSLSVKLTETLRYVTTGVRSDKDLSDAIQEEPVFLDAFKALHARQIGHTINSAKTVKINRGIAEIQNYICLWHRPNVSISLRKEDSENFRPGPDGGKTDYEFEFQNYRIVAGKPVKLYLKDFFLPDTNWQEVVHTLGGTYADGDTDLFSFSDEGLRFHRLEPKFDDRPAVVRWSDLEDVLKPGWPQVLGVKPQSFLGERKAICDTVRARESQRKSSKGRLKLLVQSLRVDGDWCYINVESGVKEVEEGKGTSYLLQNEGGKWCVRAETMSEHVSEELRSEFWEVPEVLRDAFMAHENTLPSGLRGAE